MIVIRTHASSTIGIGHLLRCRRLAVRLQSLGFEILFVVDHENEQLSGFLNTFSLHALYSSEIGFVSESEDAICFLKQMEGVAPQEVEAVLVDDYRLTAVWEQSVSNLGAPLVVVDDRGRDPHDCQLLVDAKWEGKQTVQRYQDKVPADCMRLLGPAYILMDDRFTNTARTTVEMEQTTSLSLLLNLGGGGDLTMLVELMQHLVEQQPQDLNCMIRPVVGPYATHQQELLTFSQQHTAVEPIINQDGLFESLSHTDLYVGAAGGTLFEALALRIPALTFSISDNQYNELADLEALGHYFHLNRLQPDDYPDLAKLIWVMLSKIDRLRHLYQQPASVQVDGLGVKRVADAIVRLIEGELLSQQTDGEALQKEESIEEGYQLSSVDDRNVNRYVDARNLGFNLIKMTVKERMSRLQHYIWWLQVNRRSSYLLEKKGKSLLYIWHQNQLVEGVEVLIGGWFVCSKCCTAIDAIYALNQQLKITSATFPELAWVAVIHRENRFVQQLNRRLGFKQIGVEHDMTPIVQSCFPMATHEEFFYYIREPQSISS